MDSVVAQVQSLAEKTDESGRNKLLNALRDLQYELETPKDAFMRIYNSNVQIAVVYVAVELDVFKELVKTSHSIAVLELAEKSKASPNLLERILRYLSSVGFIANVAPGAFQANKITHIFADPTAYSGVHHSFDTCGPAIEAFPAFIAETNYQDITSNTKTPFQKGHNTDLTCFQWLAQRPKLFNALQQVMTAIQSSDWLVGLDVLKEAANVIPGGTRGPSGGPFLVDFGGGRGRRCIQLLEKYPNLCSLLVLQDLPQAVDKLPPIEDVKVMAQDFFKNQTIEGAKFYYLRRVLHDWPDDSCVKILKNLTAAMSSESRILIDEVVLPNVDVYWHAAVTDITMAILFGGKEQTRKQWDNLVKQSGLRLVQIHTYSPSLYSSIIVLEL